MTTNGDLYMAYVRGWTNGAAHQGINPKLSEHADERLRAAYLDGWAEGRSMSKAAFRVAEERFGYSPSILRACNEEPTDDHES